MRIIGGKDYYDSAASWGIDPGIIFVRKEFRLTNGEMDRIGRYTSQAFGIRPNTNEEPSYKTTHQWRMGNFAPGLKVQARSPILIFCGKVYSGVFVTVTEGTGIYEVQTEHRFWNAEKFQSFLEGRGWRTSAFQYYGEYGHINLDKIFAVTELKDDALQCLMEKKIVCVTPKEKPLDWNAPFYRSRAGWLEQESDFVANSDTLKDWDFQKAFDPVAAFQEISQWVGGTLASYGPNTVEIKDDLVKAHKAGFDTKTSFRRPKQSK